MCYSKAEVIADGVSAPLSGENNGSIITFELIDNNHYQDVVININSDYKVTESLGRIGKLSTLSSPLLLYGTMSNPSQKCSTTWHYRIFNALSTYPYSYLYDTSYAVASLILALVGINLYIWPPLFCW